MDFSKKKNSRGFNKVVLKFRVLGFRPLPRYRAQNSGNGADCYLKTLFGFRATLFGGP